MVRAITLHLRDAWKTVPLAPEAEDDGTDVRIRRFIKMNQERMERNEELVVIEDPTTVDMEWREYVHDMYNHVFVEVMQFLVQVGMGMGHFHYPCHRALEIEYPEAGRGEGGKVMKWDTHVLIIPAYLGDNVKARLTREKDGETKELGVFTKDTPWDIWWLKKGTEVTFHVEAESEKERKGLAAVMVIGVLCDEDDLPREESEDEDGDEGLVDEVEVVKNELKDFKEMTELQKRDVEES